VPFMRQGAARDGRHRPRRAGARAGVVRQPGQAGRAAHQSHRAHRGRCWPRRCAGLAASGGAACPVTSMTVGCRGRSDGAGRCALVERALEALEFDRVWCRLAACAALSCKCGAASGAAGRAAASDRRGGGGRRRRVWCLRMLTARRACQPDSAGGGERAAWGLVEQAAGGEPWPFRRGA